MSKKGALLHLISSDDPDNIFHLEAEIASGAFGTVYKGLHKPSKQIVAVKVCEPTENETLDDLLVEVNLLKQCSHPNIVRFFGAYLKASELFIAMELCDGGSVTEYFEYEQNPYSEAKISYIIRETLKGLSYLHSLKIIHRDIKGENILLTSSGAIKLVDFGVSSQLTNRSYARTFIGTPYWMSPEVIECQNEVTPYDMKCDIWSIGVVAIELAECSPPHLALHPMRALIQILRSPPPKLSTPSKWSPEFHDFLERCLVKSPKLRPTSQEVLQHPFLLRPSDGSVMVDIIKKVQQFKAEGRPKIGDEDEEGEEDEEEDGEDVEWVEDIQAKVDDDDTTPVAQLSVPIPADDDLELMDEDEISQWLQAPKQTLKKIQEKKKTILRSGGVLPPPSAGTDFGQFFHAHYLPLAPPPKRPPPPLPKGSPSYAALNVPSPVPVSLPSLPAPSPSPSPSPSLSSSTPTVPTNIPSTSPFPSHLPPLPHPKLPSNNPPYRPSISPSAGSLVTSSHSPSPPSQPQPFGSKTPPLPTPSPTKKQPPVPHPHPLASSTPLSSSDGAIPIRRTTAPIQPYQLAFSPPTNLLPQPSSERKPPGGVAAVPLSSSPLSASATPAPGPSIPSVPTATTAKLGMKSSKRSRQPLVSETRTVGDSSVTTIRTLRAQKKIVAHKFFLHQAKAVRHTKEQHEKFLEKKRRQHVKHMEEITSQVQTTLTILQQFSAEKETKWETSLADQFALNDFLLPTVNNNPKEMFASQLSVFTEIVLHQIRSLLTQQKCEHLGLCARQQLEQNQTKEMLNQQLAQLNIQQQVERESFMKYTTADIKQKLREFSRKHKEHERQFLEQLKGVKSSPALRDVYQQKVQQFQTKFDEENAQLQRELQESKQEDEHALEESFVWQKTMKEEGQKAKIDEMMALQISQQLEMMNLHKNQLASLQQRQQARLADLESAFLKKMIEHKRNEFLEAVRQESLFHQQHIQKRQQQLLEDNHFKSGEYKPPDVGSKDFEPQLISWVDGVLSETDHKPSSNRMDLRQRLSALQALGKKTIESATTVAGAAVGAVGVGGVVGTAPLEHKKIIIEGFLSKKGKVHKNWKTRWFVLDNDGLHYYQTESKTKLLGTIRRDVLQYAKQGADVSVKEKIANNLSYLFTLQTKGRSWVMSASSQESMLNWIEALASPVSVDNMTSAGGSEIRHRAETARLSMSAAPSSSPGSSPGSQLIRRPTHPTPAPDLKSSSSSTPVSSSASPNSPVMFQHIPPQQRPSSPPPPKSPLPPPPAAALPPIPQSAQQRSPQPQKSQPPQQLQPQLPRLPLPQSPGFKSPVTSPAGITKPLPSPTSTPSPTPSSVPGGQPQRPPREGGVSPRQQLLPSQQPQRPSRDGIVSQVGGGTGAPQPHQGPVSPRRVPVQGPPQPHQLPPSREGVISPGRQRPPGSPQPPIPSSQQPPFPSSQQPQHREGIISPGRQRPPAGGGQQPPQQHPQAPRPFSEVPPSRAAPLTKAQPPSFVSSPKGAPSKVQGTNVVPPTNQHQLPSHSSSPTAASICSACSKPTQGHGKLMKCFGKVFHAECFACAHCGTRFVGDDAFYEQQGKLYCRKDYQELFSNCGGCKLPVREEALEALGALWHEACFVCQTCHQPFPDGRFVRRGNLPYCKDCAKAIPTTSTA